MHFSLCTLKLNCMHCSPARPTEASPILLGLAQAKTTCRQGLTKCYLLQGNIQKKNRHMLIGYSYILEGFLIHFDIITYRQFSVFSHGPVDIHIANSGIIFNVTRKTWIMQQRQKKKYRISAIDEFRQWNFMIRHSAQARFLAKN